MSYSSTVTPFNSGDPLQYQPAGPPTGIPNGQIPPPGVPGGPLPSSVGGDLLYDRPGRFTNATIQYAYVCPRQTENSMNETATLDHQGMLAWTMQYQPISTRIELLTGNPAGAMKGLRKRLSLLGGRSRMTADTLSQLQSHDYLCKKVSIEDVRTDLSKVENETYRKLFGGGARQRVTHMLNTTNENPGVPLDSVQDPSLRNWIQNHGYQQPDDNPLKFGLDDDQLECTPFLIHNDHFKPEMIESLKSGVGWKSDDWLRSVFGPSKTFKGSENKRPLAAIFQLKPHPDADYKTQCKPYEDDMIKSTPLLENPYSDGHYLLYDAFYYSETGLLSELGIGPFQPAGITINKEATFGNSDLDAQFDAKYNALYNLAVKGQARTVQWSAYKQQDEDPDFFYRRRLMRTLPGDHLYILVIGEVVRKGNKVVGGTTKFTDDRLVNLRFELSNSEELRTGSCPLFGADSKSQSKQYETRRLAHLLKPQEVIVGAWLIGTVVDSAASRPIAPHSMLKSEPFERYGDHGLQIDMMMQWLSSWDMHCRYWTADGSSHSL